MKKRELLIRNNDNQLFTGGKYIGAVKSFYYDIEPATSPINPLRVYIRRSRDAQANLDGPHVDSIVLLTSRLKYVIDINRSRRSSFASRTDAYVSDLSRTCIMYISALSSCSYNHQRDILSSTHILPLYFNPLLQDIILINFRDRIFILIIFSDFSCVANIVHPKFIEN